MNENKKITQLDVATEIKPEDIIPIVQDGTNKQITKETLFAGVNDSEELNKKFNSKADKATTLKGYGITDAYTKKEVDKALENIDLADYYTKEETDAEIVFSEEDITDRTKVIIDDEEMNTMGSEITNEKSDSKFLAYSANYLKDKLVCVSPTEPENGEEVWIKKGNNLIDVNNLAFINDGVVWDNNKYSSTKDWSGMGWDVPVEVGKTYTFKYKERNSDKIWFYINEFNAFGQRIRQIVNDGYLTKYTFTIEDENTKYVRIAYYNNAAISDLPIEDIILYEGSEDIEYEPYVEKKIFVKNNNGIYEEFMKPQIKVSLSKPVSGEQIWIQKRVNLFNGKNVTQGWIHTKNNQYYKSEDGTYYHTDYIEVSPGTTYTLDLYKQIGLESGGVMQYDENKTWLGNGIPETDRYITFTTTDNTKYVRFTFRKDVKDFVELVQGDHILNRIYIKNSEGDYDELYSKEVNDYSEEHVVGKWFGYTLYQKAITMGTLPNAATKTVRHEIAHLGAIVGMIGRASNGNDYLPLPYAHTNTALNIILRADKDYIYIETSTDRTSFTMSSVILLYTKINEE